MHIERKLEIFDGFSDVSELRIAKQPVLAVDLTLQAIGTTLNTIDIGSCEVKAYLIFSRYHAG